jgi:hypothetical protein
MKHTLRSVSNSDCVRLNYTTCLTFSFCLLASLVAPGLEAAYKIWWYATDADSVPFLMKEGKSPTDCILKENRMYRKEKKRNKKKEIENWRDQLSK